MEKVKIFIADDHSEMRDCIKNIFSDSSNYVVVGEAENGRKTLKCLPSIKPDVVIMDIKFSDIDGIKVVKRISKEFRRIKVIMFSMHDSVNCVLSSFQAGAAAYVIKGSEADELLLAVDKVMMGKRYTCQSLADKLLIFGDKIENNSNIKPFESLNQREKHILKLVSEGNSNRKIAEKLLISISVVETQIDTIMKKLNPNE